MLRCRVHQVMDPLWQSGLMNRIEVYARLAKMFGIKLANCHVGFMNEAECRTAIDHIKTLEIEVHEWLRR